METMFLVQSSNTKPDAIEDLIENSSTGLFDQELRNNSLQKLTDKDWEAKKKGLMVELLTPVKSLSQFRRGFWSQIWNEFYCWDLREQMQEYLKKDGKKLDNSRILQVWDSFMKKDERVKRSLMVKFFAGENRSGDI